MPKPTSKTQTGFSDSFAKILSDRTSGASSIENAAFDLLKKSTYLRVSDIRSFCKKLRARFPLMANILNLCEFLEKRKNTGDLFSESGRYREDIETNRNQTIDTCAKRISRYKSIFTLSNSGVIRDSMIKAHGGGWKGAVLIAESRPKNEGTILASYLAKRGIQVILMVDSAIPDMVKLSGAVFLGADSVTESYFVNKTGSRIAVDYAASLGKPVFVAADKSKFISKRKYRFRPDKNPPDEVAKSGAKSLHIVNSYFEKVTPSGKIKYITGKTAISSEDISKIKSQLQVKSPGT